MKNGNRDGNHATSARSRWDSGKALGEKAPQLFHEFQGDNTRSLLEYWGVSRCVDFWAVQGATREQQHAEGSPALQPPLFPSASSEEQHSTAQKAAQPSGRGHLGPSGGVARSLQPHEGDARRSRPATAGPKLASRDIPQYFNRLLNDIDVQAEVGGGDKEDEPEEDGHLDGPVFEEDGIGSLALVVALD